MMSAEHRRPFAAFVLLLAFAAVVMANGLRDQVVRVFVSSGGPRPLISAVVPDIVLGRSLQHAPASESASPSATTARQVQRVREASTPPEHVVNLVPSASAPVRATRVIPHAVRPVHRRAHHGAPHRPGRPARPHGVAALAPSRPPHPVAQGVSGGPTTSGGVVRPHGSTPTQGVSAGGGQTGSSGTHGHHAHPAGQRNGQHHGLGNSEGVRVAPGNSGQHGHSTQAGGHGSAWQHPGQGPSEHPSANNSEHHGDRGHRAGLGNDGRAHRVRAHGGGDRGRGHVSHASHGNGHGHGNGHINHGHVNHGHVNHGHGHH